MFYTPASSFKQVNKGKRLYKKSDLASLPLINPVLISIASRASRLIDEMEDVFDQIINADSNDGIEVTVARRLGGYWFKPTWYKEVRLKLDAAFDIVIHRSYWDLMGDVLCWHQDATGIRLCRTRVLNSEFNIDPPIEINAAIQALNLSDVKRKPLTDMLGQVERQRYGMATAN